MMRALPLLVGLGLALAAAGAGAQEQICRSVQGGRMTCSDGPDMVMRRMGAAERVIVPTIAQAEDARLAAQAQPFITEKQQKLVAAVARAMLDGRCDRAETLALKGGDTALAQEAARRCQPRPAR